MFTPPLKIHLCWSPRSTESVRGLALDIYEFLHRPRADDPVLKPGVGIPVEFGRDLTKLVAAIERGDEPAVGVRMVVPILDDKGFLDGEFGTSLATMVRKASGSPKELVVLPITLDDRWHSRLTSVNRLDQLAAISKGRDATQVSPDRRWILGSDVGLVAGRALLRKEDRRWTPRVFISHTKADLRTSNQLAYTLRDHFETNTRVPVYFDENDVEQGSGLIDQLRDAVADGVFLLVRTDSYAESPWCTSELLEAKAARVPIVTVVAMADGEARSPAYGGNHRTLRWEEQRKWEVVGRCVQAWLHHHHFHAFARAALASAGLPADSTLLSRPPELIDLTGDRRRLVVYPDPPVPERERAVMRIGRPGVRLATPHTLYGRVLLDEDPLPPLANLTLSFSLSDDSELQPMSDATVGNGLTREHLRDALDTIVLSTVHSGARIAYGGDFRKGGFAEKISDLLRAYRRLGLGGNPQLVCYHDGRVREGEARVEFEPVEVKTPAGDDDAITAERRSALWHLAMRREVARHSDARVLLGGKSKPAAVAGRDGYTGAWPGVLEEAYRTWQAGKALYVVGGFGGCAGLIARMLDGGIAPAEFQRESLDASSEYKAIASAFDGLRRELARPPESDRDLLLVEPGGRPLVVDDFARALADGWRAFVHANEANEANAQRHWPNGLTVAENRTLFTSTSPTEIAHLVFKGLAGTMNRAPRHAGARRLRCFRGDIAKLAGVEGYAVTVSPGVPNVGAFAALDHRLGGELARWNSGEGLQIIGVGSSNLAGGHVLVGQLALPAPGDRVTTSAVEALARRMGEECNKRGLTSIACPPFAVTLGLSVAESVGAMVEGFRAAGGPEVLTFCEVDAARYARVKAALARAVDGRDDDEFAELREGAAPEETRKQVIVNLQARPPAGGVAGSIAGSLFCDGLGATVPAGRVEIGTSEWDVLRERFRSLDVADARGRLLWSKLDPSVREMLTASAGTDVALVLDADASGLPWEVLLSDAGQEAPARAVSVSRRIAFSDLSGPRRSPSPSGARLRMLLVANPLEDLEGADKEADAILEKLRSRGDIECLAIRERAATVDEVQRRLANEDWDVFHYAGHAFFDPAAPERSGLELADGVLTAAAIAEARVPRLIVLGGCESARVRGPRGDDQDPRPARWSLTEGLLRLGVRALVGTFFVVSDPAALEFSRTLYDHLLAGKQLGTAVREGRRKLYTDKQPDWANFMLYGDDALTL